MTVQEMMNVLKDCPTEMVIIPTWEGIETQINGIYINKETEQLIVDVDNYPFDVTEHDNVLWSKP